MTLSTRGLWHIFRQEVLKNVGITVGQAFFLSSGRNLVISPHPDDEVLGCGGMLAGCSANGKETDILFLTVGEASHGGCCTTLARGIGTQRRRLAEAANEILGVPQGRLHFLGGRDGYLPKRGQPGFSALAEKIAACLEKSAPNAVFCPHPFEGWSDHIAAEELTRAALNMMAPGPMPRLYHYCVWFWYNMPLARAWRIDWRKARLLDIAEQVPLKRQAMRVYLDALAPCGNSWIGKLPPEFLRAFDWDKELFFETDISNLAERHQ
jgi:LmbE family N-acetylglucosaminyl deacetylase